MDNYIDRTIINLVTLIISGTGLFIVLTKFNVPELKKAFFDENPFAVKRDEIDCVMRWLFTSLAVIGLLIQAFTLICSHDIPNRRYGAQTYLTIFVASLLVMIILVFLLNKVGNKIARRRWFPKIIENQRGILKRAIFIVEHDGWREDQIEKNVKPINNERYIKINFEKVEEDLTQIESLLEIPHDKTDNRDRIDRLRSYFE